MEKLNRREFLLGATAATLAATASASWAAGRGQRVFIGSGTPDGILAYGWDAATGELTAEGVAARIPTVDWLTLSPESRFIYAAAEVNSFAGKPTGEVASFRLENGALTPLSARNSASRGTCYVALDRTGRVLISADYGGGSAASFLVTEGKIGPIAWSEHYTVHGPNKERQESAHAHFASFSPNNRFAYVNDLGGDLIHIYRVNTATAVLTPAGAYHAAPGSGPRTLHFHPNGHTAYCMCEMASTVDVLEWSKKDGSLTLVHRIELLPAGSHVPPVSTGCDTVIARDGRFVYFANRGDNFLYSFRADYATGALTPMVRTNCGGKTPRNFVLDPTERWMLVANQDSNLISVFRRNPETGRLAHVGKSFPAPTPMRILFV